MGCCGSSERPDSLKKDKKLLEEVEKYQEHDDDMLNTSVSKPKNKITPFVEENNKILEESKYLIGHEIDRTGVKFYMILKWKIL